MEDSTVEEAKRQLETNFFGTWRVCRAVLPHLRRQKSGYLVIVGSLAGVMGIPFQAAYSASKFALEGMAEALRMEVKPWGVHVVLIEPGDFRTGFTRNRIKSVASGTNPDYAATFARALAVMEKDERQGPSPEILARLVNVSSPNRLPAALHRRNHPSAAGRPAEKGTARLAVRMAHDGDLQTELTQSL